MRHRTGHVDVNVNRLAGVSGSHAVDVHAVGSAACHLQVAAIKVSSDVVVRVVQLGSDEVVDVNAVGRVCR